MAKKLHSIITDDLEHDIIDGSTPVAIHHVFYGTANRKKADEDGLIVPLNPKNHTEAPNGVHHNHNFDRMLKAYGELKYVDQLVQQGKTEEEAIEIFARRYGRNYLP